MGSKIELLAEKVEKVLDLWDESKQENASLKAENANIKAELAHIHKEINELKLGKADRSETIKTKLTAVLGRLKELEALQQ